MISINIYWLKVKINTDNEILQDFIKKYYELFLYDSLKDYDLEINLQKYNYFQKIDKLNTFDNFTTIWDDIKVDYKNKKYFFKNQEITGSIQFLDDWKVEVNWFLKPRKIHHIVHILLQWFDRIDKFYNRFIIKTLVHDPIFILLEKKLSINILHATAVTNWDKTFIFSWLWWSWKSTLASTFLSKKWYKILSDNYCFVKNNLFFPFPELPRITNETIKLLWIKKWIKADWIKTYLTNELNWVNEKYKIDKVFICSYWKDFKLDKINDKDFAFELLLSINNYTKEFPEYLNLSMLSILWQYNTWKQRYKTLEQFVLENDIYLLENNKNLESNIEKIENV